MAKKQTNIYLEKEDREFLFSNPEKTVSEVLSELIKEKRFGVSEVPKHIHPEVTFIEQDSQSKSLENVRIE